MLFRKICWCAALLVCLAGAPAGNAQETRASGALVWTPKPLRATPYKAPNRPRITLAQVVAKHRGQARWRHVVGRDHDLELDYVQMAPGDHTPTQMLADHRLGLIVWDGQLRVTIEGQEPFVASKGFLIQVPFRVPYKLETIGDQPSLHLEVRPAGAVTLYPASETPPPAPPGQAWQKSALPGRDTYERQRSVPYLDFFKRTATPPGPSGVFMRDDRNYFNVIRGAGIPRQPDSVRGHFHADLGEYWFIMEGEISFLIEGEPFFVAEPGDVVYAPAGRFHSAQFAGSGMSTRIAIMGYPYNAHIYEADGPRD